MPTPDYVQLADSILGEIKSNMPPIDRIIADNIQYEVEGDASDAAKDATGTPHDYTLLGMYQDEPTPKITIYESSIKSLAHLFGGVAAATKEALVHEIFQHGFGLDHTRETQARGVIPAFAVKTSTGKELEQWH